MRWPFSQQKERRAPPPPEAESLPADALERLGTLERSFAQLQLEWSDTLDKIQRWAGRMAARERQRIHRDLEAAGSREDGPGDTNGLEAGVQSPHDRKAALRARAAQIRRIGT